MAHKRKPKFGAPPLPNLYNAISYIFCITQERKSPVKNWMRCWGRTSLNQRGFTAAQSRKRWRSDSASSRQRGHRGSEVKFERHRLPFTQTPSFKQHQVKLLILKGTSPFHIWSHAKFEPTIIAEFIASYADLEEKAPSLVKSQIGMSTPMLWAGGGIDKISAATWGGKRWLKLSTFHLKCSLLKYSNMDLTCSIAGTVERVASLCRWQKH